jgi:hypothetical protein
MIMKVPSSWCRVLVDSVQDTCCALCCSQAMAGAAAVGASAAVTSVAVSIPQQVLLQPGCDLDQACHMIAAAGLQYPVLVKPLVSAATDSGAGSSSAEAAAAGPVGRGAAPNDGHTLGVIFNQEGLAALLTGQQQQQPGGCVYLPAVLQQYVPHQALYKVRSLERGRTFSCWLSV